MKKFLPLIFLTLFKTINTAPVILPSREILEERINLIGFTDFANETDLLTSLGKLGSTQAESVAIIIRMKMADYISRVDINLYAKHFVFSRRRILIEEILKDVTSYKETDINKII